MDLLVHAVGSEANGKYWIRFCVVFHEPTRKGGDASTACDHLQHDVGRLDDLLPLGCDPRGGEEARIDVEPVERYRIGEKDFIDQIGGLRVLRMSQGMPRPYDEHLFVVEDRFEMQSGLVERIRGDEQIDVVGEQRPDSPELELLLHVQIHHGPRFEVGRGNLVQPLVARMAFHPHPQGAALALRELGEEGTVVARPKVGVMLEVPATLYQLDALAERTDFFSVGSNDLTQYLLAVDRNNPRVADLYDACHPAVLSAMARLAKDAKRLDMPISVCGELAGDTAGALLLMGMGFDALSMNAPSLPRVRAAIRRVPLDSARTLVQETLALNTPGAVRAHLIARLSEWQLAHLLPPRD